MTIESFWCYMHGQSIELKVLVKIYKCVNAMAPTFVIKLMDVNGYQPYKNELRSNI